MAKRLDNEDEDEGLTALEKIEKWKHEQLWSQAQMGFTLIKPWILEQFKIDTDDVQITEILDEVIEEALKPLLKLDKLPNSTQDVQGYMINRFAFQNKHPETYRSLCAIVKKGGSSGTPAS